VFVKKALLPFMASGLLVSLAVSIATINEWQHSERLSMKNSFKLQEAQQQAKEMESWVKPMPCVICSKMLKGPYGRHVVDGKEVWTCSLDHEGEYNARIGRTAYTPSQVNY
jgi:hypothetical protein